MWSYVEKWCDVWAVTRSNINQQNDGWILNLFWIINSAECCWWARAAYNCDCVSSAWWPIKIKNTTFKLFLFCPLLAINTEHHDIPSTNSTTPITYVTVTQELFLRFNYLLLTQSWLFNDLTIGYRSSNSANSSKFHHLALLPCLLR